MRDPLLSWRLHLTNASHVAPENVRWAWEGRMPLGALSLLVGPAGRGKSTLAYDLAARVTRGQLGRRPANVIIATSEDSLAHTSVPRLMAAGADLERVDFATIRDEDGSRGLTLPDDIDDLAEAVVAVCAELVVLDPVVSHISGDIDSHKDHSVRRALDPIGKLAEATRAAVLGIGHLNKAQGGDVLYRLIGSVGFGAAARSVLLFAEKPNEEESTAERVLLHGKCNLAPLAPALRFRVEARTVTFEGEDIGTSGLAWLGVDPSITAAAVLAPRRDEEPTERDIARDVILDALADGDRPWSELAELVADEGVSEHTGRRARDRAKAEGEIESYKDGSGPWRWKLTTPKRASSGGQVEKHRSTRENGSSLAELAQSSDTGQVPGFDPSDADALDLVDFDEETDRIAPS